MITFNGTGSATTPDPAPPVSGMTYWLDTNQETGYVDEDAVNPIQDWSGNNNDISQAASGQRARYDTGMSNGRPAYRFDGTDDFMDLPVQITESAWTLYCVLRPTTVNNSGNRTIIGTINAGGVQLRINSMHKLEIVRAHTAVDHTSTAAFSSSVFQLLVVAYSSASGGQIKINGVSDSTFGVIGWSNPIARLAYSSTGGPNEQYDGWIAELLLYPTKHNSTEISDTETWALGKHNL